MENKEFGCIECKLYNKPVNSPLIYALYERACKNELKLSILVARKINDPLKNIDQFKTKSGDEVNKKSNMDKNEIYFERMTNLVENNENRINMYVIESKQETENEILVVKFKVTPVKEHSEPTGVFIMVETNFNP